MQQIFATAQVDVKDCGLTLKTSPQGEAKTKWYLMEKTPYRYPLIYFTWVVQDWKGELAGGGGSLELVF